MKIEIRGNGREITEDERKREFAWVGIRWKEKEIARERGKKEIERQRERKYAIKREKMRD